VPIARPARENAEELSGAALGFLAADSERLGRFLDLTGLTPTTIRAAAGTPGFLLAVLEHLLADEPLLLAFADTQGCDPSAVAKAREQLAGPFADGWREG
jgi:hypothetical protein